ncbi:MAG: hypothetical protein M3Q60_18495 [Actinomycetota bacterium]|nr:hypothetical protein [Actinomycetota bacterium]
MAKKDFAGDPGGLIGDAIFSAIKPIYKEGEKAKRARRAATRRMYYYAPEPKVSQKEIVFSVLGRAIRNAGAFFSARDLYYATRPLAYAHPDWDDDKRLEYKYFSQGLLIEYQEIHGPISGLWRDPRGNLHEPHTGKSVAIGTREIAAYQFPEYSFDKILYVEKEGEWPKLQAARLAERYDMAIASAKGYPVEAVRELFARAEGGDYQLFVFHDADIDGYEIARVLGQETRRMPEHSVEVIDIGLSVEDALEMGIDPEPFSRKKRIPYTLSRRISDVARDYFVYRKKRFELNAILPDTSRIQYIERKLEENGVRGKVIPPDDALGGLADEMYREEHDARIDAMVKEMFLEELKEELAEEFKEHFELDASTVREGIEKKFEGDRALSWRDALKARFAELQKEHDVALRDAVREKVRKHLEDGE